MNEQFQQPRRGNAVGLTRRDVLWGAVALAMPGAASRAAPTRLRWWSTQSSPEQIAAYQYQIDTFEAALAAEPDRAAGRRIPPHSPLPEALLYRRVVAFSEQLERAFDALGRHRVHVIVQEEMKGDTERTMAELFAWLGVAPDVAVDTRPVNRSKAVRSEGVRRLLRATPSSLKSLIPARLRRSASKRLRALNSRHVVRTPLSPETRARLMDELAPEVARIEATLGRRIAVWHADGNVGQGASPTVASTQSR